VEVLSVRAGTFVKPFFGAAELRTIFLPWIRQGPFELAFYEFALSGTLGVTFDL
jgi:hypothetical protein